MIESRSFSEFTTKSEAEGICEIINCEKVNEVDINYEIYAKRKIHEKNSGYVKLMEILWLFFFSAFFSLFFIFFVDRICYFFTYPKWNDVYMEEINFSDQRFRGFFPKITISSQTTEAYSQLREDLKIEIKKYGLDPTKDLGCLNLIADMVEFPSGPADKLWEMSNFLHDIDSFTSNPAENFTSDINPIPTIFGTSASIVISNFSKKIHRFEVTFNVSKTACRATKIPVLLTHVDQTPDVKEMVALMSTNEIVEFYPIFKIVKYISTRNDPCLSNKEFDSCYQECLAKRIKNNTLINCKFPFVHESIDLKWCNGSKESRKVYSEIFKIYVSVEPMRDCPCSKPCEFLANFYELQALPWPTYNSQPRNQISVVLTNRYAMEIRERLVFDTATFFCEIGGLFALFLGFGLLKFLNLIYRIMIRLKITSGKKSASLNNSDIGRFGSSTKYAFGQDFPFSIRIFAGKSDVVVKIIWSFMFMVCFLVTLIIVIDLVERYYQNPTRNFSRFDFQSVIQLPSVAICGESARMMMVRKKAAKKQGVETTSDEKLCTLSFIDASDGVPKTSELWTKNNFDSTFYPLNEVGQGVGGFPLMKSFERKKVILPGGTCTQYYNITTENYAPMITLFPMAALRISRSCFATAGFFIADLNTENFHLGNEHRFRQGEASAFSIFVYKISRLNSKAKPCVDEFDARLCQQICTLNKIQQSKDLECSLPYMVNTSKEDCTSRESAKKAQRDYFRLMYSTSFCNCPRICNETFTTVRHAFAAPGRRELSSLITLVFGRNYVDEIVELSIGNCGKLICNIGAVLGLFVGVSFLSSVQWFYSIVLFVIKKRV